MAFTLKSSPGHLLRRAQQYAHDLYAKEVGAKGPTPRQFEVLHTVAQNEGLSQTDLVRATGIDRSTLADMIARMIKKGLLSRHRTKADARANAVSITPSGKRMLSSAMSAVNKAESGTIGVLPASQRAAFVRALSAYAEALDKMGEGGSTNKKARGRRKGGGKAARKGPAKRKAGKKRRAKRR
ncbi:MAG TPA: MarR family transcriptional regulator [Parvularculaceae bacterium]|nr:MarR family transcriptional regulator [Parvularculaceae bacterium]